MSRKNMPENGREKVELNKGAALGFMGVALMYLGSVMGAGVASGREVWQYFGLFGREAFYGVGFAAFLFVAVGMMTVYIALELKTADMGKIILPVRNHKLSEILGYIVALFIYTALIAMSAAGGALLNQQFGISRLVGGILIVALTILTVLGDFERVSKVFQVIMPVLFVIVVGLCIYVIATCKEATPIPKEAAPSPMAASWAVSAGVYVAYNIMGTIPIMAHSALSSKGRGNALFGALLGGIFLAVLDLVLVLALQTDGEMSHKLDMPMLGFATQVSKILSMVFALVLFCAVYSAATSTYYGFTSKLKDNENKKKKVILFAILGFALGLFGFKNIIAYVYPIEGYFGFLIIILITINFFRVLIEKKKRSK